MLCSVCAQPPDAWLWSQVKGPQLVLGEAAGAWSQPEQAETEAQGRVRSRHATPTNRLATVRDRRSALEKERRSVCNVYDSCGGLTGRQSLQACT